MKKLASWQVIYTIILFILSLTSYLFLETQWLVKIVFILLGLTFIFLLFYRKQFYWLFFLTIYLVSVCIYYYQMISAIPIWATIVLLLIIIGGSSYILVNSAFPTTYHRLFYSLLIYIVSLEIFLVMLPWPIIPQYKGLLYLVILYLFWGILDLKISHESSWKKFWPYIVIFTVITFLVISLSSWVGY